MLLLYSLFGVLTNKIFLYNLNHIIHNEKELDKIKKYNFDDCDSDLIITNKSVILSIKLILDTKK